MTVAIIGTHEVGDLARLAMPADYKQVITQPGLALWPIRATFLLPDRTHNVVPRTTKPAGPQRVLSAI